MKKFTENFLHGEHGMLQVLRKIGLSMVAVLLAVVAFGQPQDTYHVFAEGESSCYLEDNAYKVTISFRDFVKIDSFSLTLGYNDDYFEVVPGSFDVLRDEISLTSFSEPSSGSLLFKWDVNWELDDDDFKSIEPNNDTTRVMCFYLRIKNYNPFYGTVAGAKLTYQSKLEWEDGAFWNDVNDITDILTNQQSGIDNFTITQIWDGIEIDQTQAVCNSDNVVATVVSPTDSDLEYSWNGDEDFTGNASTNILAPVEDASVEVRNADGCISYQERFDVETPTDVTFSVQDTVYTQCPGGNGDVEIYANFGSEPYTYYLIPASTFNINNIGNGSPIGVFQVVPGTYYAAVQDVNDCVDMSDMDWWETVVVIDDKLPWSVVETVHEDNYCHGGEEGKITLTFNGATGPYAVTFDGEEVEVAEGGTFTLGDDLVAGDYTVYAIDDEGCAWSEEYTITEPTAMDFEVGHIDASCEDTIGAIWIDTLSITGGTQPYWKWGITTELPFVEADAQMYAIGDTATGLAGGIYYVRLYDAEGCFEDYTNDQGDDAVKILTLDFDFELVQPVCSDDSASVTPFLVSGDGNHELIYYIQGLTDTMDIGDTYKLPALGSGTDQVFQLRIYDKTTDCGWGASLEVETPDAVWLDIHERYTLVPTCPGGTDGLIAVTAGGGTEPYIYKYDERQWVEAEDFTTFAATAGEHTIVVRDANGCEATAIIDLDMEENYIEFQDTIYNDCTNQEVNLMHQYGAHDTVDGYETFIYNLAVENGGYLTDFNWTGGSNWHTGEVVDPGDHDIVPVYYWGSTSGWDTLTLQGRVWQREPVLYVTSVEPTSVSDVFTSGEKVTEETTLPAGKYWLAAKDEFGCVSNIYDIDIIDPKPLEVTLTQSDAACYGQTTGEIKLEAFNAGGWIPGAHSPQDDRRYEYVIYNQDDIFNDPDWVEQVTWRPFVPSATTNSNDSVIVIDVIGGMDYYIAVREACGVIDPDLIWESGKITIASFPEFTYDDDMLSVTDVTCHREVWDADDEEYVVEKDEDGAISLPEGTVTGGDGGPYTFTLTGPDDFEDVIEGYAAEWTGLADGDYDLVIEDEYGCPPIEIDITVDIPDLLTLDMEHINPSCVGNHDGLLVYRINGGTYESKEDGLYYGYQEATNNITELVDVDELVWFDVMPETVANDPNMISFNRAAKAGTYVTYIRDAAGCISGPYFETIEEPAELAVALDGENPYCTDEIIGDDAPNPDNGSITVAPSGGWESSLDDFYYVVTLKKGSSTVGSVVLDKDSTHTWTGLGIGTYTATVVEFNDTIADAVGYDGPYNEIIDYFDYPFWDTIAEFAPYQNANDCSKSNSIELVYDGLDYDTGYVTDVLCYNTATGTLTVEGIHGGKEPYSVMLEGPKDDLNTPWVELDDDEVDYTFEDLVYGHYTLHVRDNEGCQIYKESWEIENIDSLQLMPELYKHPLCHDGNATVVLHADGGTGAGTYKFALVDVTDTEFPTDEEEAAEELEWSEEMVDTDTFLVPAGIYIGFVMDANGCIQGFATDGNGSPILIHRVEIENPTVVEAVGTWVSTEPTCFGEGDGEVVVPSVIGGSGGAYTAIVTGYDYLGREVFEVYTSDVSEDDEVVLDGLYAVMEDSVYSVVFQDNQKCPSDVYTFTLGQPEEFKVSVEVNQDAFICPDDLAGVFELIVISGGVPFDTDNDDHFKYKWEVFDGHPDSTGTSAVVPATAWSFTSKYQGQAGVWYRGTALDANGCEDDTVIYVSAPEAITYEISDVTCFDADGGTAHIEITQSNPGRTYYVRAEQVTGENREQILDAGTWLPLDADNTLTFNSLSFGEQDSDGGHYYFYVKDNKGCIAPDTFITFVPVQTALALDVDVVEGECTDEATITVTGGIPPYVVTVDDVVTDVSAALTWVPGTYVVVVTDAHGCTVDPITVTVEADQVVHSITVGTDLGADGVVSFTDDGVTIDTTLAIGTHAIEYVVDGCTRILNVTVEDVTGPIVVAMSPQGELTEDGTRFDLELTLNDNVVAGLGAMKVFEGSTVVAEFDVTEVTITDNVIKAPVDLDKFTTYYVNVPAGFVADSKGNNFAGILDNTTWTFTTKGFITSGPDAPEFESIKLYPNPFSDKLNIENAHKLTRVIISNIAGQRVIDIEYPESVINTPNLVSGVYVVTMFTEDGIAKTERIVKR